VDARISTAFAAQLMLERGGVVAQWRRELLIAAPLRRCVEK
jgi:hypothetical protein